MDGSFACPECGAEIRLAGLSPGRLVRCGWCRTDVEVPYIPRADQVKRLRRSKASSARWPVPLWMKAAIVVLGVLVTLAIARRTIQGRWQRAETEMVARLVESSREAEAAGRLGEALAEIEAATAQAGALKPAYSGLVELRERRDQLARREAEALLAALESPRQGDDPARQVGRALTLRKRVRTDEALDGLEPRVDDLLERLRLRWVEADAQAAESADAAGRPGEALELCRREFTNADDLPSPERRAWQARATDLARRIIERHGLIVEPIRGTFTLGSPNSYATRFHPGLHAAFCAAGYLPRPAETPWDDLWSTFAPYRFAFEVKERQDETYLQSMNHVTSIEAALTLTRRGETIWRERPLSRTTVPLPKLPALQASRVSVGDHRSPEFERLLYENAREGLLHQLQTYLKRLPPCPGDRAS